MEVCGSGDDWTSSEEEEDCRPGLMDDSSADEDSTDEEENCGEGKCGPGSGCTACAAGGSCSRSNPPPWLQFLLARCRATGGADGAGAPNAAPPPPGGAGDADLGPAAPPAAAPQSADANDSGSDVEVPLPSPAEVGLPAEATAEATEAEAWAEIAAATIADLPPVLADLVNAAAAAAAADPEIAAVQEGDFQEAAGAADVGHLLQEMGQVLGLGVRPEPAKLRCCGRCCLLGLYMDAE